jgi:hypothetical protein
LRKTIARLTTVILLGFAAPAPAQVIGDSEVIETLMLDYGLPVHRGSDDYGDPWILSEIDGIRFSVYFYDCAAGGCGSIQFIAGFDEGRPVDLRRVNSWNREYRFAKAYLDESGHALLEMDVNLAADGVGRRNFNDNLDSWRNALAEFRNFLN